MARLPTTLGGASAPVKSRRLSKSIVPLAAMGLVLALATLLLKILLTSPATHGNLVR